VARSQVFEQFHGVVHALKRGLAPEDFQSLKERRADAVAAHSHPHRGEQLAKFEPKFIRECVQGLLRRLMLESG
jgi:hypothetical protein